ncbi:Reticulocyte-binding protein 2 a [Phytophthora citrophthora]|uniref:Reticulocyte-binding protein 2 a n=1 Tax=Phytophthora citrophthora TaxID=4793 RepID=A0AAD9LAZ2_9STRA|nr:Reticulocyte-binding protein 2 a [Phytophthora citrophthora]
MAEPRSIRGFLRSRRKHKHSHADSLSEEEIASTSSLTSDFTPSLAMEGMLKKRAAKMPVMHDRYCVATWEMDADDRKCVMLRSYKNRKSYDAHPEKPTSVHQLKCISDWDGKTGFHRYQHAFTMETRDKKLFQCVAPCAADKDKWVELMAIQSAFNNGRDMRLGSVGSLVPLRRTQSVESAADSGKPRAYTSASIGKQRGESDVNAADAEHSTDSEDQNHFPGHDGLFRTTSGTSTNSLELPNGDKSEPADWGLYGEANGETKSKYEIQDDAKPVLLDKELLDARGETKTLASDKFLFEEAGASRFGTVVVKPAAGSDDEDADFIDVEFAAREAQKENEKNMKRRAQKLESNRDLYAEMAATRLAKMRKDARHPKKSQSRPSDDSDVEEYVKDESIAVEGEVEDVAELEEMQQRHSSRSRRSSKNRKHVEDESIAGDYEMEDDAELEEMQQRHSTRSRRSSKNHKHVEDESIAVEGEVENDAELEEVQQRRSSRSRRSSKSHKKSVVSSENTSENGGYVSGDDEVEVAAPVAMTDTAEVESAEAEELRQLKKKYRAERRAKKLLIKEKEEEERTAQEAAELARAHREEQRAREEAKAREEQEKRDKKERREMKEKLKREKAKQRQAEAELRKLVELKQAEEERREREHKEKKEKKEKKKSKKKEKYTSPAERIHKKEERDAERAAASAAAEAEAQMSNALVVVEKPAEPEPAQQPLAAPEPAPIPVPTPTVPAEVAPVQVAAAPATTPATVPAPVAASVPAPAPVSAPQAAAAMPMYQMAPPPFVPTYSVGPQSMPAYGLAATFGAYPPMYPAPYSYGGPVGMQPAYMRPNMGFMAGLSAMGSFGKAAGPDPAPSSQDAVEPMIGPQLPTPVEHTATSSVGASAPPPPPPPSSGAKLTNLPELPDVIEF